MIKRLLLAVIVLAYSAVGYAMDFEFGTGYTKYSKPQNGVYYQEGYPYHLDLEGIPTLIGLAFHSGAYTYRTELVQLGQAHVQSLAQEGGDRAYLGYANPCAKKFQILGNGNVSGLAVSVARSLPLGRGSFYGELGLFSYRQNWKVEVTNEEGESLGVLTHTTQLDFRPFVGVGYQLGNVDFSWRMYKIDSHRDNLPFISSEANTLMVGVHF